MTTTPRFQNALAVSLFAVAAAAALCTAAVQVFLVLSTRRRRTPSAALDNDDNGDEEGPHPHPPPLNSPEERRHIVQQMYAVMAKNKMTMRFPWEGAETEKTGKNDSITRHQRARRRRQLIGNNITFATKGPSCRRRSRRSSSSITHLQQQHDLASLLCQPINASSSSSLSSTSNNGKDEIDFLASMTFANSTGLFLRAPSCPCCQ
jgi:hypothetical protein